METKKAKKVDLEKKSPFFIQIGLIITLSIVLVAFEWTSNLSKTDDINMVNEIQFEDEMMQITRRDEPKPEPKPEQPKVAEVLDIVDDDVIIEDDFDFDIEADDNSEYDFTSMMGDDEEIEEDEIFYIVEDMPTFNGGDMGEFWKYAMKEIRYPEIAAENGVSGTVYMQFTVNTTGLVTNVKVVKGVHPDLDNEAIRVITNSPKWEPGKQRGRKVKVIMSLPMKFILQ